MDTKITHTIQDRQQKEKTLIVEQLKKTPIIQVVCEKVGIARATYYRWKQDDEAFAHSVDEALAEGTSLVNDIAESQLMSAIKNQNLTAIIFWLRNHHAAYATRVEVTARLKTENEVLTPEQETLVTKALKLASLLPENTFEKEEKRV